ncbi:5887_t:CDS:2 [Funneliformis mosseae]|uniref:5887_t:CDS:1 n=1 Tax=Funneliformis mosseae TaxID=27381 RepID=A0A9N8YN05_FUNMO|nr:5887_t:CDS:2 [Funneliformis mosseae]
MKQFLRLFLVLVFITAVFAAPMTNLRKRLGDEKDCKTKSKLSDDVAFKDNVPVENSDTNYFSFYNEPTPPPLILETEELKSIGSDTLECKYMFPLMPTRKEAYIQLYDAFTENEVKMKRFIKLFIILAFIVAVMAAPMPIQKRVSDCPDVEKDDRAVTNSEGNDCPEIINII